MKYKITCESSADLNPDMYKKLKVSVIPFRITLGALLNNKVAMPMANYEVQDDKK